MKDERFLKALKKTQETLHKEYETWQYAEFKPQGIDSVIDAILDAKHEVEDIISSIERI